MTLYDITSRGQDDSVVGDRLCIHVTGSMAVRVAGRGVGKMGG